MFFREHKRLQMMYVYYVWGFSCDNYLLKFDNMFFLKLKYQVVSSDGIIGMNLYNCFIERQLSIFWVFFFQQTNLTNSAIIAHCIVSVSI